MTEHTPGPWVMSDRTTDPVGGLPGWTIGRANDVAVAFFTGDDEYIDGAEGEANARLCAAAPYLLSELEHIVRSLDKPVNDGRVNAPGFATLNGAKAAIARARGDGA